MVQTNTWIWIHLLNIHVNKNLLHKKKAEIVWTGLKMLAYLSSVLWAKTVDTATYTVKPDSLLHCDQDNCSPMLQSASKLAPWGMTLPHLVNLLLRSTTLPFPWAWQRSRSEDMSGGSTLTNIWSHLQRVFFRDKITLAAGLPEDNFFRNIKSFMVGSGREKWKEGELVVVVERGREALSVGISSLSVRAGSPEYPLYPPSKPLATPIYMDSFIKWPGNVHRQTFP